MGVCSSNKSNENKKNNNQVHNNNNKIESQIKKNGKKPDDNNKNQEQKNEIKNNNKQSSSIKNQNKKTNTTNNPSNKEDEDLNKNYIRIIIYDNNKEIFSRPYDKETKFSKIFEDIKNRYLNDENYYDLINNKSYYKIDNELIDESKEINKYLKQKEDRKISVTADIKGLRDISNNIEKFIYENIKLFGKISFSPFQLYIYKKEDEIFKKALIEEEEKNNSQIKEVSMNTSFCNGINKLYLFSGGENDNLSNLFWIIDLKKLKITKIDSQIPSRKHHSLIYIPKKYVFIIGGQNDKTVYYFDTFKQKFFSYSDLSDVYIEPGLIMINNTYLYVFSNIGKSFLISKTNLRVEPKWEKIIPKIPKDIYFTLKYFGVCKTNNNSIIFIGGNDMSEKVEKYIYEFNYENNEIIQSLSKKHSDYDFPEKTFIPFNEESYVLFPNAPKRALKKVTFNKNQKIINVVDFENDNESRNSQYKIYGKYEHKVVFPFDEKEKEIDLNNPKENNKTNEANLNDNKKKELTLNYNSETNNINNDKNSIKSTNNNNHNIIEEYTKMLFADDKQVKKHEKHSNRRNKPNEKIYNRNGSIKNLEDKNNELYSSHNN